MEKQKTITQEIYIEGIGLHTGNMTKVTFRPAPDDYGICFIREDLPDKPSISATYKKVLGAIRGTTIGDESVRIHTVEHILAACSGLGIDNLEVLINNNEPPILDGSAKPFVELFLKTGLKEQNSVRNFFILNQHVKYESGETTIEAYPSDSFKIDCTIGYKHPALKQQQASFTITPETFIKDISAARTFCFDFEIEALTKKGLGKGGNFSNAIVIGLNGIHNDDKTLRFKDEFVRHKILDLIGDIYLLGQPIKANIKAVRCGHNHNINFTKELAKLKEKFVVV